MNAEGSAVSSLLQRAAWCFPTAFLWSVPAALVLLSRQLFDRKQWEVQLIEGRNGTVKRRFGLDLMISKLDETAKTEAALNILAMNASHKLDQWFARFFVSR